jgi:hypothetical protein
VFKLGKFAVGNKVYVLTEVAAVTLEDTKRYVVKTNSAKFYVKEDVDMLVLDPEQDITTATELYNVLVNLNNMPTQDFKYVFEMYNSIHGTAYEFNDIRDVLGSGMPYTTLLEIYNFYLSTNEIKVGDIVRVLVKDSTDTKYCAVLHVEYSDLTPVYTLYDADEDYVYHLTREEAQIVRYNIEGKETAPIESLLDAIKENISDVTGDINRTHDDPWEEPTPEEEEEGEGDGE